MKLPVLLLVLSLLAPTVSAQDDALKRVMEDYRAAIGQIENAYTNRLVALTSQYKAHVDQGAAQAQARGDLDQWEVFLKESAGLSGGVPALLETEATTGLREARAALSSAWTEAETQRNSRLLQTETALETSLAQGLVHWERMGEAGKAAEVRKELESCAERLKTLAKHQAPPPETSPTPPPPEPAPAPKPALTAPLLTLGDFEGDADAHWIIWHGSHYRNNTEVITEPLKDTGGTRNRVLRLQRDRNQTVQVRRRFHVPLGVKEVQITWRTRQLKPPSAEETRGLYQLGVEISPAKAESIPVAERGKRPTSALIAFPPPSGTAWESHTAIYPVDPLTDRLAIQIPNGRGEWILDDVEVRGVLPPPEPKKAPAP